jgi:hypothetical protein
MYVAVLSAALIVSVIGLSALAAVRVQRLGAEGTNDLVAARFYARSAIEMGLHWIRSDPNWRDNRPNGVWAANVPIGNESFTLEGTDPDALPLNNDLNEPLVLTGIGVKGDARYKLQVTLVPESQALTCLEVALHAGADLVFDGGGLQSDQTISTNLSASQIGTAPIVADVEAVNTITLNNHTGLPTEGITARTLPDPITVFDYYLNHAVANGTWLTINDIPTIAGKKKIQKEVLSPTSNPYGAGNKSGEGIYVVDCMGQYISVRMMRIVGTLVLLEPGSGSWINDQLNWKPAIPNYPALLVRGNIVFNFTDAALEEGKNATNYNPPGTPYPYPGGASDPDQDDVYPSLMKGLVYVSGNLGITKFPTVEGVAVVGNTFTSSQNPGLSVTYQPTFLNNPPPGFGLPPTIVVSPGSWQQVVD